MRIGGKEVQRVGREESTLVPRLQNRQGRFAAPGSHFRGHRYRGHTRPHVHTLLQLLHTAAQSDCSAGGGKPARICPYQSPNVHRDAWRLGEQQHGEISEWRRGGRPARAPQTNVAHRRRPAAAPLPPDSTPAPSLAPAG